MTFELIPAIDLLGGRVVRLAQGDFERATAYSDDPTAVARRWAGEGASRLHLVDLDGAKAGRPVQASVIRAIVEAVDIPCQVAGGLRDASTVAAVLTAGADRVVLGTALLKDPQLGAELIERHGATRIVAAIDVRDGIAVGAGWVAGAEGTDAFEAVRSADRSGVTWYAVTAIERDGLMEGPDFELLTRVLASAPGARILASAGVTTLEHIARLKADGMAGAILGRALYEGVLDLGEALRRASSAA